MKQCSKCGFMYGVENETCPACGYRQVESAKSTSKQEVKTEERFGQSIFVKGADLIDSNALYQAGICKLNGLGMEKDETEALEIFRILAFRGHTDGMYKLAEMYLNQNPPNREVAVNWLKIASENGHSQSIIRLKMLGEKVSATVKQESRTPYRGDGSFEDRVQNALPCIVSINSVCHKDSHLVSSFGSGFIIEGGFVVSNAHVIGENPESIAAKFDPEVDVKEYQLVPLKVIQKYDVAILRFKGFMNERISERQNLELRTGEVRTGEEVYTIGNPLVLGLSLSKGVISSPKKNYAYKGIDRVIQTDITINHGNSGGALLDKDNNVLGLMSFTPGSSEGGIGMAVPAEYIEKVLNMINTGE